MSPENINTARPARDSSIIINVRFKPEDKKRIHQAANAEFLPISSFIRQAALRAAKQVNADTVAAS